MIRLSHVAPVLLLAALLGISSSARQPDLAVEGPASAEVVSDEAIGRPVVKGQLLVTLHKGITAADLKPIFERFEAKVEVAGKIELTNTLTLVVDHDRLPELRQRLENHPFVASAAFNGVAEADFQVPKYNDPIFKKPADMPEDKDNWNLYRIKVPEAWEVTTGGATVAVVDSGTLMDHEDLANRTTQPHSFATNGPTMDGGMKKIKYGPKLYRDEDPRNHGTHVSVTIGGRADNGVGTVGVAPNSPVMPLQALFYKEAFPAEKAGVITGTDDHITRAMAMGIDRRAAVINMSLGNINKELVKQWKEAKTDAERDDVAQKLLANAENGAKAYAPFLDRATRSGVVVVVAAGNNGAPAEFGHLSFSRRTISIAATTREDGRATFSNYGSYTTVSAPGKDIWSAYAEKGRTYDFMSGTSMACPHAAGVVALMKTIDPELRPADAADILIRTGRQLETDLPIGPLINARAAVDETRRRKEMNLRQPDPPPLIPEPGVDPRQPQLPGDGINLIRGPAPWTNPNIQRIIRLWLAFANARPPAGGNQNVRWFFTQNGQPVNNRTAVATPRPVWFRFNYRWLWENAGQLDSTNMGTLFEFTTGTLRLGKFDPAPTRVPENVRPGPKDPQPRAGGLPLDPGLGKTKWTGTNGKGEKIEFDFTDKTVTLTRDGKATKYTPRVNPYVFPMTLTLYPDGGGEPIRAILHMTDLDQIAIRTDFTSKLPKDAAADDPQLFKLSRSDTTAVASGRGFADGDGKSVDPRFAAAEVCDGTTGGAGEIGKAVGDNASAGPRSAILSQKLSKGIPLTGHYWAVREFKDGAALKGYVAKMAKDPRFTTKSFDTGMAGFIVKSRDIGDDHIVDVTEAYAKVGNPYEQSSHINLFIYRERFLVSFSLWEGKRGHDFKAESKAITENTKKLIDLRFPPE